MKKIITVTIGRVNRKFERQAVACGNYNNGSNWNNLQ